MSEHPDTTVEPDGSGDVAQAVAPEASDVPDAPDTLDVAVAELRPALEAILMVTDEPLDQVRLASVVGHPVADVEAALEALAAEYAEQGRGFDLRPVAGGWRFYSRAEFAGVVESFVLDGQAARLTQAALETLSVVAYKQPVSRARVSAIRGVNVDGVMRTLLTRGLVHEVGQDEQSGANLYGTTAYFLERIGITSIEELPELAPYLPDMDDLEDELASVAGRDEPAAEPAAEPVAEPVPEHSTHHASPHSGQGTEPDGGTEIS
ncbi:segregation and condensation protein B [Nocardioides alpinus]|uniref:SMC-Scp complex subunit ScpB n=1 Tax=Nocardioides alpinus TaxID=748909 RepID=A0A1I1BEL7_9ACTN|nr:SMC-Scp complex subunit ScpB [Nocardioides alpinus]PKH39858.1 SMC-Scp complex subunit ScpB [Nocardioides alpinus]SFB48814.1 segregation and condensation protein B [Nocardioides alpinus]